MTPNTLTKQIEVDYMVDDIYLSHVEPLGHPIRAQVLFFIERASGCVVDLRVGLRDSDNDNGEP
jgi:hypothetical protein